MKDKFTERSERNTVEVFPGITKKVMSYGEDTMMVLFNMKKGSKIPLHAHDASQNGYVISGKVRLFGDGEKTTYVAGPGAGYYLASQEPHGLEVLEDAELVECFSPMRKEFIAD